MFFLACPQGCSSSPLGGAQNGWSWAPDSLSGAADPEGGRRRRRRRRRRRGGGLLGVYWEPLAASWGCLLGASWGLLGASWGLLGPPGSLSGLRARNVRSGPPSGHTLGAILGASWAVLEASWAVLGPSWAGLGQYWRPLEPSWSAPMIKGIRRGAKATPRWNKGASRRAEPPSR